MRRALWIALAAVIAGCPHDPCAGGPCEDYFWVTVDTAGDAPFTPGTYEFTVRVDGFESRASCVITGDLDTSGCTLAQPENPDLTLQPRIVLVKSSLGLENLKVDIPSTPATVDIEIDFEGQALVVRSFTPTYTDVRNEPQCEVACRVFSDRIEIVPP